MQQSWKGESQQSQVITQPDLEIGEMGDKDFYTFEEDIPIQIIHMTYFMHNT